MSLDGLVDLQVNGFAGTSFSSEALTVDQVIRTCNMLFQQGTSTFLPTVISSPKSTYELVLPILAKASEIVRGEPGYAQIAGIHLEGPFISPENGARGIHPQNCVLNPDLFYFDWLFDLSKHSIALLTLAPERPGAIPLIQHATRLGVKVGIGHTAASPELIHISAQAGAQFSTHLGNGLPLLIHRHLNPLWAQLADTQLTAFIIADGHHLPADFITTVFKVKSHKNVIVVSDSSPAAGLPPGFYDFFGCHARLDPSGLLYEPTSGLLAGSSASLRICASWLENSGFQMDQIIAACRDNPASFLQNAHQ